MTETLIPKKLSLIIVDDDADDLFFLKTALQRVDGVAHIHSFLSGGDVLSYLHSAPALPDMIISDLKMPLMTGFELLERIRASEHIRHVPVTIFSTSTYAGDIDQARILGATAYIAKPFNLRGFQDTAQAIADMITGEIPAAMAISLFK